MDTSSHLRRRGGWWFAVGLLVLAVLPGCVDWHQCCCHCWFHDSCACIPPGAIPPPPGAHVNEFIKTQAGLAEADDFVIYEHEWDYDVPTRLDRYGQYHLGQMLKRLPEVPFPVLIQAHPDEALNQARRAVIVTQLGNNGIADADARVLIGFPQAEGLFGEEAADIYCQGYVNHLRYGNGNNLYNGSRLGLGGYGGGIFGGFFGGFGRGGLGAGFFR